MSYYNRKKQLLNTLDSIKLSKAIASAFLVLVDDASDEDNILKNVDIPVPNVIIRIEPEEKTWCNPCIANNIALRNVPDGADVILLQNPENYHVGDILSAIHPSIVRDNEYHVFNCYCLSKDSALESDPIPRRGVSNNYEGWISHPRFDNNIYNYAVAFKPTLLNKIGLFDEQFAHGICRDDDDFSDRIRNSDVKIIRHEQEYVKHQYHDVSISKNVNKSYKELFEINDAILAKNRANRR